MTTNQFINKNCRPGQIIKAYLYRNKQLFEFRKSFLLHMLISGLTFLLIIVSCDTSREEEDWMNEDNMSISQYLQNNQEEYSKFTMLLDKAKLLNTLYAYNPYGTDYTLFLPTNEAIDHFISQNQGYDSFEDLLNDTSYIKTLGRYHILNRKVHTDEFPDGALEDMTLTGERLVTGFYAEGNNQLIKVNNKAPVITSNLKMTNGYIHVITEVLQQVKITGYDWLQQQQEYSILAQAIKLSGIKSRLWWKKYTILAEHDSIYKRNGINNVEDLVKRIATPGMPVTDKNNAFNLFAAYHFLGGEFYLNDLYWGNKSYTNLAGKLLTINVGVDIQINKGIDIYGYNISSSGDTTFIDYIKPIWIKSNVMTSTGPVHSINNLLFYEPLPEAQ